MADITVKDFIEQGFDGLRREMTAGFDGVNDRLDRVNGRLDKHGDRLTKVEDRRAYTHQRTSDPAPVARLHSRSDDGKPITRRDVVVGVSCSGAAIAALLWILQVTGKL